VLLLGLNLGLFFGLSRSPQSEFVGGAPEQGSDRVWSSIQRLEAEQQKLKSKLSDLRLALTERQQSAAAQTGLLQELNAELDRQQLLVGLMPLEGPGIMVTLDDSEVQIPQGADPNAYIIHIIHEYDLRDIVNLLWMAGSEAIAINDERLVNNSSVYCAGSTVMVNNTRLSPPYVIRAIGNPRVLQDYLRNPSYLINLREKQRMYGLRFEVMGHTNLTLPAYSGGFLVQYARLGE
jgi:uncharacterized protein YlxW (UPF0749 family)